MKDPHWRRLSLLRLLLRMRTGALIVRVLMVLLFGTSAAVNAGEGQTADAPIPTPVAAPAPSALPPSASPSAPPSAPPVIPVDQIAPRAAEVAKLLRNFAASLVPGHEVEAIRRALPSFSTTTTRDLARTMRLLDEQPSLEALQTMDQAWLGPLSQSNAWLALLTKRATQLQTALDRLTESHDVWAETRDSGKVADAPAPILQQIDATLAAIEAAQPSIRVQRDETLDLQGQVAAEVVRCETVKTQIETIQRAAVGRILVRDGWPIWSPEIWHDALASLPARLSQISATYSTGVLEYVRDPSKRMAVHVGLFLLALLALLAARRRVEEWEAAGQGVSRVTAVFDHPWAAALLLGLMAATVYISPAPFAVKQILSALALAPLIILARPVVNPVLIPALYALGALFALDTFRHALGGSPPALDQGIVFVESLAGIAVLAWLLIRGRTGGPPTAEAESGRRELRRLLAGVILVTLIAGLVASGLGYLRAARITAPAVLIGAVDALWLYGAIEVGTAVIAFALRAWPLRRLRMVQRHRWLIETRIRRLLIWMGIVAWFVRYLHYLGLWEPMAAWVSGVLASRIGLGSFSTSPGDVVAFLATISIAYLFSSVLRFVLQEDIYPRMGVPAGASYAASSLIHYVIVAVAFLIALGVLGVTLTQVTVLAGALGVGIGFGLQGVVNNFVSGLILLFERPIHVGDAVQVGDLQGWVRRIGIRASVVRTIDGAEIIVPNSQLITSEVTNWTLSDQQRRVHLPVGLSYGSPPRKVIDLLEGVARAHPRVATDPPPQCLFLGYGDSSIDFELRVWTDYATWVKVRSDLAVAVYDAVYAAGLSFPFPQREVRLLPDKDAGFTAARVNRDPKAE